MDNATAAKTWKEYVNGRVPMVIRTKPDDFENDLPIVLVPQEAPTFVIAKFPTAQKATEFCAHNRLPVLNPDLGAKIRNDCRFPPPDLAVPQRPEEIV
jgi:hypothetical protein